MSDSDSKASGQRSVIFKGISTGASNFSDLLKMLDMATFGNEVFNRPRSALCCVKLALAHRANADPIRAAAWASASQCQIFRKALLCLKRVQSRSEYSNSCKIVEEYLKTKQLYGQLDLTAFSLLSAAFRVNIIVVHYCCTAEVYQADICSTEDKCAINLVELSSQDSIIVGHKRGGYWHPMMKQVALVPEAQLPAQSISSANCPLDTHEVGKSVNENSDKQRLVPPFIDSFLDSCIVSKGVVFCALLSNLLHLLD